MKIFLIYCGHTYTVYDIHMDIMVDKNFQFQCHLDMLREESHEEDLQELPNSGMMAMLYDSYDINYIIYVENLSLN